MDNKIKASRWLLAFIAAERLIMTSTAVFAVGGSEPNLSVLQYADLAANSPVVIIGGDGIDSITDGDSLSIYRMAPIDDGKQSVEVEIANVKVLSKQGGYALAEIHGTSNQLAKSFFPKYPDVMAGDLARLQEPVLNQNVTLLPEISIKYKDLFIDPKARPVTFELSEEGRDRLRDAAAEFADRRVGTLLVEAHTDTAGSFEENQVESMQRALTIRQILITELGFDPDRIVAVGFGESESRGFDLTPMSEQNLRKIVIHTKQE